MYLFTLPVLEKRAVDSVTLAISEPETWPLLARADSFTVHVQVANASSSSISDVVLQSSLDGVHWTDIALAYFDTIAVGQLNQDVFFFPSASPGGCFVRFVYKLYTGAAYVTASVTARAPRNSG